MVGPLFPDLSVQLTQRRWRCVLDPILALSPAGAEFARRLAPHVEIWLGTEFFNILDSTRIYQDEPELLAWPGGGPADETAIPDALRDWTRLRDEAGYGGSPFHWIGDVLRESCLPAGMNEDVVVRWEGAARALDACLPRAMDATGPLIATLRDTVALCAVLPAAILTVRRHDAPELCDEIARWGVACERLAADDELVAIERDLLRHVLVQAGLAKILWGGMNLVVIHVQAAGVARLRPVIDVLASDDFDNAGLPLHGPWDGARAFWYDLRPGRQHVR